MVKSRLALVACFFIFGFGAVAMKAVEVMVFKPKPQSTVSATPEKRERMEIIDRNGKPIATNLHTISIYANPREMIEKKDAAKKLSSVLREVNMTDLEKEFASKKVFTWVKRNVTPQEQNAVNHLGIPGIYFTQDVARVYPQGRLLSHILGYVDVDNHGLAGVEREFEELLNFNNGEPLQLSVDVRLQQILHEELSQAINDYHALGGAGIVIDVTNGEVIALISLPDFDPNAPGTATPNEKFNRVTLGTYELGSVVKGFTAAVGLDTNKIKPNSVFDATHSLQIGKYTIHDYHAQKRMLTVTEILEYSSNVGTARMGLLIGNEKLREYFKNFGMLDYVPIEIPERGFPQVQKKWTDIVTANVSFGHGIAVSPAHIARGYQAIVNGGFLHPLTLMKKKDGDKIESIQVISKTTSDEMRTILRDIVLSGTGKNADSKGYLVAGKTGTADKAINGKYVGSKVISSFAGSFPINNPKYMIYVVVDEPQEKIRGVRPTAGIVAAPIVKNFVDRAAPLLGMKPQFDVEPPKNETYTKEVDKDAEAFASYHD